MFILTRTKESWRYEIEKVSDKEDQELPYTHRPPLPLSFTILPQPTDSSVLSLQHISPATCHFFFSLDIKLPVPWNILLLEEHSICYLTIESYSMSWKWYYYYRRRTYWLGRNLATLILRVQNGSEHAS